MDLGQAQPLAQPLVDQRLVWPEGLELRTGRRGLRRRPRAPRGGDRRELVIGRPRATPLDADGNDCPDALGDGLAAHPGAVGDCPDTVAAQPPARPPVSRQSQCRCGRL
jgi:hypothetical protein